MAGVEAGSSLAFSAAAVAEGAVAMQVAEIKKQAEGRRRQASRRPNQHLADPYRKAQRELTKALGKRQAKKLAKESRRASS